jgi:hypothetical protein
MCNLGAKVDVFDASNKIVIEIQRCQMRAEVQIVLNKSEGLQSRIPFIQWL